jgi:hypothetical protein
VIQVAVESSVQKNSRDAAFRPRGWDARAGWGGNPATAGRGGKCGQKRAKDERNRRHRRGFPGGLKIMTLSLPKSQLFFRLGAEKFEEKGPKW